jgi:two-component system sensor histidine kinase UhpB
VIVMKERIKILLIEDNPGDVVIIREMIKEIDGGVDLKVTHVDRLERAIKYLRNEDFDILLLDLNLPDSQGIETFRAINRNTPDLPIIILTGLVDEEVAISSVGEGAQDYLLKGQTDSQLLEKSIKYSIERKGIERELRRSEERYRLMVEKIQSGVFFINAKNKLKYVNEAMVQMLGYTIPEMLDKDISQFTDKKSSERIRNHLNNQKKQSAFEVEFINKNGANICFLVSNSALFKDNGKYIGSISIMTDISARKGMEESLVNAMRKKDRDFFLIMGSMLEAMKPLIHEEYAEEFQEKFT